MYKNLKLVVLITFVLFFYYKYMYIDKSQLSINVNAYKPINSILSKTNNLRKETKQALDSNNISISNLIKFNKFLNTFVNSFQKNRCYTFF